MNSSNGDVGVVEVGDEGGDGVGWSMSGFLGVERRVMEKMLALLVPVGLVWVIWSVQLYWGGCGVSVGINLAEE